MCTGIMAVLLKSTLHAAEEQAQCGGGTGPFDKEFSGA